MEISGKRAFCEGVNAVLRENDVYTPFLVRMKKERLHEELLLLPTIWAIDYLALATMALKA